MQNVVEFQTPRSQQLNWSTIIGVAVFHTLAVAALFYFSWTNLLVAAGLWWVSGSLGIGLGYHRLLTHRGYTAPRWLEYTLAVCGSLAVQSGPLAWVTTHRKHHAYTETEKDPHSPRTGIFWSHMGWILKGEAQIQSDADHKRFSPDLVESRFLRVLDKYYWMTSVILGLGLFAVGGVGMLLWGLFLRTVIGWHATWAVNSVTHLWGSKRFETRDDSRNNPLVAALTFGEGWHNNHHAYPRSARHGLKWYEVDVNWIQIWALEKLGVISDVYAFDLKDDVKPMKKAA